MPDSTIPTPSFLLECIAGKDSRRKIIVSQGLIRMGNEAMRPDIPVTEIFVGQGYIEFTAGSNTVHFDASHCSVPVYLNNHEIRAGKIQLNDTFRIGDSLWRIQNESGYPSGGALKGKFNELIGLEELKDFKLSSVFSEVLKKHSQEEMEDQLITGTARHTPALAEIEVGWGRPWLFARLFFISALLAIILYVSFDFFANIYLLPGLIFVGSFAVPVSTLVFFLEMNAPRNVSIFTILQLAFTGGIASLILALFFYSNINLETYLGASAAGIIEESAKLLIVALMMGKATRYRWILNGLLLGAAIGTGFAAFESAGYAFDKMLKSGVDAGAGNILSRGILAPFGHIVWTANAAAALWLVKGNKPFKWEMLQAGSFLRIFVVVIVMHMIWNAPFTLVKIPVFLDLKYLLLGLFAWVICFRLIQAGLKQLSEARQEELKKTI